MNFMSQYTLLRHPIAACIALILMAVTGPAYSAICTGGALTPYEGSTPPSDVPDLEVKEGVCTVPAGTYYYRNVNIHSRGTLSFDDATTNFWASSIVVENNGSLVAGSIDQPVGTANAANRLTIFLYGKDQGGTFGTNEGGGQGALCVTPESSEIGPCGIPTTIWGDGKTPTTLSNGDWFYQYTPLPYDGGKVDGKQGYFGYKVLAVSYGGTINLFGKNGAIKDANEYEPDLTDDQTHHPSGKSWARLVVKDDDGQLGPKDARELQLDRAVDWQEGDRVVVSSTDYIPSHAEELEITKVISSGRFQFTRVENCDNKACGVQWAHNGKSYDLSKITDDSANKVPVNKKLGLDFDKVENRAAVGLLSRNIRVVSGGDTVGQPFPAPPYHFGGHTIARQGFKEFKVQGVEFKWMGQGGKIGHYPVHFHLARQTTKDSYVKDSSVNESMTRWMVIHGTGGVEKTGKDTETVLESVLLARNVGYKSIGHGFYLEDGTEANNRLYYNLGVFARAAVTVPKERLHAHDHGVDPNNPREVPGILAASIPYTAPNDSDLFPYRSDYDHPTVFWIMNSWNEFVGNMAAGAGTCGAGYWLVPGQNSGPSGLSYDSYFKANTLKPGEKVGISCQVDLQAQMKWKGYASLQQCDANAGSTPLKRFSHNSAMSTMNSLMTIDSTALCGGISVNNTGDSNTLHAVLNNLAPSNLEKYSASSPYPAGCDPTKPRDQGGCDGGYYGKLKDKLTYAYYPNISGGVRKPTLCRDGSEDCYKVGACSGRDYGNCAVNVIDHYTTAFHWAETNFSAVWLRSPDWFLFSDSVISDVQNGGLTFVTGGGYARSDAIEGYWSLARKSVFVGKTQPNQPYGRARGPFDSTNSAGPLAGNECLNAGSYCLSFDGQISMPLSNWAVNQRLFNIYDGPSFQSSNAYLDIKPTTCAEGDQNCWKSWMYGKTSGIRKQTIDQTSSCYLPHAAIGWKQPNGFYYPPAFHSDDLFFHNVSIRHYVLEPVFKAGTYQTDNTEVRKRFCGLDQTDGVFKNFTDIDRQTFLNDDDGSLTGLCAHEEGLTGEITSTCGNVAGNRETISVNADPYFNTPEEVPECRSNVGVGPSSACKAAPPTRPSANTSPEEYVSTVVYPGDPLPGPTPNLWNSECNNETCFGVPLYRQYFTSTEYERWTNANHKCDQPGADMAKCNWPFIRMAGQSIPGGQRSTLTANHGTYFIDTTASEAQQRSGKWMDPTDKDGNRYLSVFQKGRVYNVFFLFAKDSLSQTYQIYVGKQMKWHEENNKKVPDSDVFYPVRANPANGPVDFKAPPVSWPANYVSSEYDPDTGILTVSVDLSGFKDILNPKRHANGSCKPTSFCKWENTSSPVSECVSALPADHPMYKASQEACGTWAVKDLDCPLYLENSGDPNSAVEACVGFAFKMPTEGFEADDVAHRPQPSKMVSTGSKLVPVSDPGITGSKCHYAMDDLSCLPK